MKVLHVQKVAKVAGSENHLLTLLPELAAHGVEPAMLVLEDGDCRPEEFIGRMRDAGVRTERLPIRHDADPGLVPRLARFIRRGGYDAVHTHLLHADLYGRVAGRLAGVKVLSSYHCDDPHHLIPGVRQMDAVTARACHRIICISAAVRDFVRDRIGVPGRLLTVVHYGLEPGDHAPPAVTLRAELGIPADAPVVGMVGRLTEQKGHVYLLDAFARLRARHPDAWLVLVGNGELRAPLERQAAELGIAERVRFTGYRTDGAALMRQMDVVTAPSIFEGFGLVLLEGMAAGRPIVASRVSAIPEIVADGETGTLVPPRDPAALANAIGALLADPARADALGAAGRARLAERFTVEKMVRETAGVYRSVVAA
jgi:glycosyltransferase involved in cell wall biosynthesis